MNKETSEIAKLTGRISKDPKSKLFVPLAEEYKKAGDIDMAIHVLLEGIKSNPEYVVARSSLGKLLIAKGDLAGAQKEFEEVVKASPDNLMAQKKLGDLFIIQNRPQDALQHYNIARSLNPDDGEMASLIADVEAGRDVRSKIQGVTIKTTPEKTDAGTTTAPPISQPGSPVPMAVTEQLSSVSGAEAEEAEEVLFVEPLEPETSLQELPAAGMDLSVEHEQPVMPSVVGEEHFGFDFPEDNQLSEGAVVSQDIGQETELLEGEERETIPIDVSGEATGEIIETSFADEESEQVTEPPIEDVPDASDDFTTDTLAELYISQGFFEKAVEIYERMLVDKPNSRGLQDKLALVRAEVARTAAPAQEQEKVIDVLSSPEAREYVPVPEAGEAVTEQPEEQQDDVIDFFTEDASQTGESVPTVETDEILIEAEVVTEPDGFGMGTEFSPGDALAEVREDKPAAAALEEQASGGGPAGFTVAAAVPVETPLHKDFEPREYVPPGNEQIFPEAAAQLEAATHGMTNTQRKETIARLETWLTTIKKEK